MQLRLSQNAAPNVRGDRRTKKSASQLKLVVVTALLACPDHISGLSVERIRLSLVFLQNKKNRQPLPLLRKSRFTEFLADLLTGSGSSNSPSNQQLASRVPTRRLVLSVFPLISLISRTIFLSPLCCFIVQTCTFALEGNGNVVIPHAPFTLTEGPVETGLVVHCTCSVSSWSSHSLHPFA